MKRTLMLAGVLACGGGGSTNDGGVPDATMTDANVMDAASESPPPPMCGTGAWLTYGHDGARSFASDACIAGPLTVAWTYAPTPPTGKTINGVHHALASTAGVFLQWAASDGQYIGTTAADLLSPAGARLWTFDSGSDANFGNWASVSGTNIVLDDDGEYFVDTATGKSTAGTGVDWWGQTIPAVDGGVWFADTSKSDGPGLFVGALDSMAKLVWQENKQGTMCGQGLGDVMGGIAVDGGVLFYAPSYTAGAVQPTFMSGLYAFDAAAGTPKWNVNLTPASAISAGNGFVYLIEAGNVVARKQTDGSVAWMQPVTGAGAQAPVLAAGLAIVASTMGVSVFDAVSGKPGWSTPLTGAAARPFTGSIMNGCAGSQSYGGAMATTLAAAVPSGTLVVTASDGIHLLSLATGMDVWHGAVMGATNAVHDPVLVGKSVYVVDSPPGGSTAYGPGKLIALTGT
jgi:hypothetical protein